MFATFFVKKQKHDLKKQGGTCICPKFSSQYNLVDCPGFDSIRGFAFWENIMATIPLTVRGAERLQAELHRLKHVERPAVINAIAEARAGRPI